MPWNNGYEQKKFEEEQKRLAKEYRAAGMSEEQIYQMYLYDLERHNSLRREREHTQSFPDGFPEDDPEGTSPLNRKFLSAKRLLCHRQRQLMLWMGNVKL